MIIQSGFMHGNSWIVGSDGYSGTPSSVRTTSIMGSHETKTAPKKQKPSGLLGLGASVGVYFVSLPGVAVNSLGLAMGLAVRLARLGAVAAAP